MAIDPELLQVLRCPETHQPVTIADEALIASLNEQIAAGTLTAASAPRSTNRSTAVRPRTASTCTSARRIPEMLIDAPSLASSPVIRRADVDRDARLYAGAAGQRSGEHCPVAGGQGANDFEAPLGVGHQHLVVHEQRRPPRRRAADQDGQPAARDGAVGRGQPGSIDRAFDAHAHPRSVLPASQRRAAGSGIQTGSEADRSQFSRPSRRAMNSAPPTSGKAA